MALSDTWLLRIPPSEAGEIDYKKLKWEKRKKVGYAPTPRSGCTMALWGAKKCVLFFVILEDCAHKSSSMGVLFGGVSDEDKDEETLDSTFYNELCVSPRPCLAHTRADPTRISKIWIQYWRCRTLDLASTQKEEEGRRQEAQTETRRG